MEDIDRRCRSHQLPYAVIGGITAIVHGSLRVTADIDVTLLAEIDDLEHISSLFADDYNSLQSHPLAFFQRCFFVPLEHKTTKIKVDVAAALSGFERLVIERSQRLYYK